MEAALALFTPPYGPLFILMAAAFARIGWWLGGLLIDRIWFWHRHRPW